ncbi:MAG: SLOG family protein [Clostridia bacterium]
MFDIVKEKTASFSGHRNLSHSILSISTEVEKEIRRQYELGVTTFLCGMAIGFDMLCGEAVLNLKKELKNLKLVAVIPCVSQANAYPAREKERYDRLKEHADKIVFTSENYSFDCMFKRNRFLIDNSAVCICYLLKSTGGTFYTVNYANSHDIPIIDIRPKECYL